MIGRLRAWLRRPPEPAGLEALFTEPEAAEVERKRRDISRACYWLREALPEVWYARSDADVIDMAEALVTLREGVEAGRWEVEAVKA